MTTEIDLFIDNNFDLVTDDNDYRTSKGLKEQVLVALTTSNEWWAEELTVGGNFYNYVSGGGRDQRILESYIRADLDFLNYNRLDIIIRKENNNLYFQVTIFINDNSEIVEFIWD